MPFAFATQNQIHQKLVQGYADIAPMMPRWASCINCSRFNPSLRASTRRGDGLQPIRRLLMYTDRLVKFAAKQTAILVFIGVIVAPKLSFHIVPTWLQSGEK